MTLQKKLYILWAALYGVCALLSLIPNPGSLLAALMFLVSMGFFVPGAMLLRQAIRSGDRKTILRIRYIAIAWLAATAVLLVLNVMSVTAAEAWGKLMYYTMALVSAPMISSQVWMLPVFLWGCLLFAGFKKVPKQEENKKGKKTTK